MALSDRVASERVGRRAVILKEEEGSLTQDSRRHSAEMPYNTLLTLSRPGSFSYGTASVSLKL